MTLPYSRFPFERSLKGIKASGYEFVALGTTHPVDGKNLPILKNDDSADKAKEVGQKCRDAQGVVLVVKQHGGETGTGEAYAAITKKEVSDPGIMVNFDAGNVMDYLNVDPIADLQRCVSEVRSFCIKDHRNFPKSEDCGPGFGEIDHYKLLAQVAHTGLNMPLCCENIFAPLLLRPDKPEGVDLLAKRAREFLETVIEGLQREEGKSK